MFPEGGLVSIHPFGLVGPMPMDVTSTNSVAGPLALMEFRIWERGHINRDTLKEKLEEAIRHALWDVVLEYRLLPFPFCTLGASDYYKDAVGPQSLPCSEPTTPVRRKSRSKLTLYGV